MDEIPWHETVSIPALLRHARTTYGAAMRRALEAAGHADIPGNGLYVIGALALGPDRTDIREIVRDLRMPREKTQDLITALVARGYLDRSGPERAVALTARGRAAAEIQAQAREVVDAVLIDRIGADDVAAARRTLAMLIDIGRETRDAPGA